MSQIIVNNPLLNAVRLVHSGGVGDGLMLSSVIKEKYCKEYDMVYLDVQQGGLIPLFKVLYNDTENIQFGTGAEHNTVRLNFIDGVEGPNWREMTWNRRFDEENRLYNNLVNEVGKDYIIVHERPRDNVGRGMYPINRNYFENESLPVVNVHLREGHIMDYSKILQNAKEIHVYEGSFMNLTDAIVDGSKVPLYGHLYCKQHYFDKNMIHHQIIEYIKAGKWHKNNWNYLWEISETLI